MSARYRQWSIYHCACCCDHFCLVALPFYLTHHQSLLAFVLDLWSDYSWVSVGQKGPMSNQTLIYIEGNLCKTSTKHAWRGKWLYISRQARQGIGCSDLNTQRTSPWIWNVGIRKGHRWSLAWLHCHSLLGLRDEVLWGLLTFLKEQQKSKHCKHNWQNTTVNTQY